MSRQDRKRRVKKKARSKQRFQHCRKRASSRYHMDITYKDWSETIPSIIASGFPMECRSASLEEVREEERKPCHKYFVINFNEVEMKVAFDMINNEAVTFLEHDFGSRICEDFHSQFDGIEKIFNN